MAICGDPPCIYRKLHSHRNISRIVALIGRETRYIVSTIRSSVLPFIRQFRRDAWQQRKWNFFVDSSCTSYVIYERTCVRGKYQVGRKFSMIKFPMVFQSQSSEYISQLPLEFYFAFASSKIKLRVRRENEQSGKHTLIYNQVKIKGIKISTCKIGKFTTIEKYT